MLRIAINNQQQTLELDKPRLRAAIKDVVTGEGIKSGEISVAVVDDATIHELNRQWLNHDEPTDVLSFVLDRNNSRMEGEIIISAETAASRAGEFGWAPHDELLLYLIHGALHLTGYDDKRPADRERMRERERFYLDRLGLQ